MISVRVLVICEKSKTEQVYAYLEARYAFCVSQKEKYTALHHGPADHLVVSDVLCEEEKNTVTTCRFDITAIGRIGILENCCTAATDGEVPVKPDIRQNGTLVLCPSLPE